MTADWYPFEKPVLSRVANRIIREVPGINRVVYMIFHPSRPRRSSGSEGQGLVMSKDDDWKIAIEDARHRHAAIVNLIYFTFRKRWDSCAFMLRLELRWQQGAAAALSSNSIIPWAAGWSLGVTAITLSVGSWFCFRAMGTVTINLPGRGAEFWLWAAKEDVGRGAVFTTYLDNLKEKHAVNNSVNERTSKALRTAKVCGMITPFFPPLTIEIAHEILTSHPPEQAPARVTLSGSPLRDSATPELETAFRTECDRRRKVRGLVVGPLTPPAG